MSKISVSATGNIIEGHVLDMSRAPLEQALRFYDSQLYVKWNAKKLKGWGCWELRRRPELKSVTKDDLVVYQGNTYVFPKYREQDLVHHVMDIPFLNYSILTKLKKMDLWTKDSFGHKGKNFTKEAEYLEAKYDEKVEQQAEEDKNYMIKQHRTQINDFRSYVLAGGNPHRIADYWGK